MLRKKLLPAWFRAYVRSEHRRLMWGNIPEVAASLMQFAHYFPHQSSSNCYTLPIEATQGEPQLGLPFPIPPLALRADYGHTPEDYLESGREDVEKMREICAQSGVPLEVAGRILELGCAGGRLIRWLRDSADSCEIWGVDIWASAILWCKQYLSPPFHFATTTVCPHLPFEDHYFGFIYAGSVFTHIDDLVDAWFLELRRVLRPGGRLYITIIDRSAISIFDGKRSEDKEEVDQYIRRYAGGRQQWEQEKKSYLPRTEYHQFKRKEVDMVAISRGVGSRVFWDVDFLCKRQQPFFRLLSATEKAYGHQTGVLIERV